MKKVFYNVPGRLHSVSTDGQLGGANEIFDDDKLKNQAEINADVDKIIGTDDTPDTIKGRIKSLEKALNDVNIIGSYTKSETYNKTEIDNKIASVGGLKIVILDSSTQLPTPSENTMGKIYFVPISGASSPKKFKELITVKLETAVSKDDEIAPSPYPYIDPGAEVIDISNTLTEINPIKEDTPVIASITTYAWEEFGNTATIELSNYYTKDEIENRIPLYLAESDGYLIGLDAVQNNRMVYTILNNHYFYFDSLDEDQNLRFVSMPNDSNEPTAAFLGENNLWTFSVL